MRHSGIVVLFVSLWLLMACGGKRAEEKVVMVTIEPQRFFAEQIAGDRFVVRTVVPSGQSPETYDPTPRQMVEIGQSIAYLRIGAIGFEQAWMQKIAENNPQLKLYDLSDNMPLLQETEHEHSTHAHQHGGVDPHIWSSIEGARVIAWNTLQAFIELDKEHTDYYWANYNRLATRIDSVETVLKQRLAPVQGSAFIIYHPALTYLAAEFGLHQLCIEMDGKEPSPAQLEQLVEEAKAHRAQIVFVQQEFDQKNARLIAQETGCRLVAINPLNYHWEKELIHIADALSNGKTD